MLHGDALHGGVHRDPGPAGAAHRQGSAAKRVDEGPVLGWEVVGVVAGGHGCSLSVVGDGVADTGVSG
jgi:NADPH:quinone reductase-like Zn-dependent oxidoreductase